MKYDPKDAEGNVFEPGEYEATLSAVVDGVSKTSGAEMQTWTFEVYHPDGRRKEVKDYVTAKAAYKIRDLADAIGKRAEFDAAGFDAINNIGEAVVVCLKHDEFNGQTNNKIKYITAPKAGAAKPVRTADGKVAPKPLPADVPAIAEDDIPF